MGRSTGEAEEIRRRKISEARRLREAVRRGEVEAPSVNVETPDDQVRRQSHTDTEVRHLEKTYDLELVDWLTVGGEYLYEFHENGHPRTVKENAGLKIRVPVFRRKRETVTPKVSEWH